MILKLDADTIRKAYAPEGEILFDPYTYEFHRNSESNLPEYLLEFPSVPTPEAQRAYINTLNHRRLREHFARLSDSECSAEFWNLYENHPYWPCFEDFEQSYQLEKIKLWCDENQIAYYIDCR